jgi:hypothetical protein
LEYLILFGLFALWVLWDGLSRKMGFAAVLWTLGTAVLGVLIVPVYLAERPLKRGEVREGGTAWNILKNFAILWTLVMICISIKTLMTVSEQTSHLTSDAERAGAGIGMALGMGMLGALWFLPTIGAAGLGFLLKKNSVVETGPTGTLVGEESKASVFAGWLGLIGTAVIALIVVGLSSSNRLPSAKPAPTETPGSTGSASADANTWFVSEKRNEMDNTREVGLMLDSENDVEGFIGSHKAHLHIRCSKRHPEVFVDVGGPFESVYGDFEAVHVRLKFDDAAPVRQRWTESTNNEAAFAANPAAMMKQMLASNTLLFEFTPFQKRETTLTFRMGDLREKLKPLSDVCRLK